MISSNQHPPHASFHIIAVCSKTNREGEDRGLFVFALSQVYWWRRRRTLGRGIDPCMEVASGDPSKSAMAVSVAKKMPLSASQRDGAGELRKQPARPNERRRQPHIQAVVEDENEEEHSGTLRFRHSRYADSVMDS